MGKSSVHIAFYWWSCVRRKILGLGLSPLCDFSGQYVSRFSFIKPSPWLWFAFAHSCFMNTLMNTVFSRGSLFTRSYHLREEKRPVDVEHCNFHLRGVVLTATQVVSIISWFASDSPSRWSVHNFKSPRIPSSHTQSPFVMMPASVEIQPTVSIL